jgi:hypothetical protein
VRADVKIPLDGGNAETSEWVAGSETIGRNMNSKTDYIGFDVHKKTISYPAGPRL